MAAKDYVWGNKYPHAAANQYKWVPIRSGPMKKKVNDTPEQILETWRAYLKSLTE